MNDSTEGRAGSRRDLKKRLEQIKLVRNLVRERAREEFIITPPLDNDDESRFADKVEPPLPGFASFTKALKHDKKTGLVVKDSFDSLLTAIDAGTQEAFEDVILGGTDANPATSCEEVAPRRLANPLNAYSFQLIGNDSNGARMEPAPAFGSRNTAVDMVERYWMALCRDIPFDQYESTPLIQEACDDLNNLNFEEEFGFKCTPETIFRGPYEGCFDGPHVSQFLLQDFDFGNQPIDQRQRFPKPGLDFMTDLPTWLKINNGEVDPTGEDVLLGTRYISTLRDAGQWVHIDFPHQSSLWATIILLGKMASVISDGIPYAQCPGETRPFANLITKADAFGSLGGPDITITSGLAAVYGLKHAWFQKWGVHRRLRPEVYAQRLELFRRGGVPGLGSFGDARFRELFGAGADVWSGKNKTCVLERILEHNKLQNEIFRRGKAKDKEGTYLLPMGFPEGSPTHPSYPGGHSAFIAAGATIAKALFEDTKIASPQVPNADGSNLVFLAEPPSLTVHGELNKLIANVTLFRDGAGMHWRTDGTTFGKGSTPRGTVSGTKIATGGNLLGENMAISMLKDLRLTYREKLDDFEFNRLNGEPFSIPDKFRSSADD
ncbi:MAG: phosphatidic acid phosphatase [Cyanobacteria bacterium J06621_8]